MITVVGIDPGLRETGYAVLVQEGTFGTGFPRILEAGVVKTKSNSAMEQRLNTIFRGILEVLSEFGPEGVAIEALYSDYKNPKTAILMGHARGAILLACAQNGCSLKEYTPSRIKKALTGNGSANKEQVQKSVQRLFHLPRPPSPDHVSDAIAVALCYLSEATG